MRRDTVLEVIDRIYAAAEDPKEWADALRALADAVQARTTALVLEDFGTHRASVDSVIRADPALAVEYERHYAARNVWMEAGGARFLSGVVLTSEELVTDRALTHSEYYNDFLRRFDARYLLTSCIFRDETRLAHVSLMRGKRAGAFGQTERKLLDAVLPHLQRAARIHRRMSALRAEGEALVGALDRLPFGVILLDATRKPVVVNAAASKILESKDGISLGPKGLAAYRNQDTVVLDRVLKQALPERMGGTPSIGGTLAVARRSLRRPYTVVVAPLASAVKSLEPRAAAAVFITDPEQVPCTDPEHLRQAFAFTPAEARFAVQLLAGDDVGEAADRLQITVNTARTHVRHLLDKTETHRMADLVRILTISLAGVARS